jgi:flagellar biosynthesis/type III secretory pathway M-ring protein FliF/YscJ
MEELHNSYQKESKTNKKIAIIGIIVAVVGVLVGIIVPLITM